MSRKEEPVEIKRLDLEDVALAQKLFLILQNVFEVENSTAPSLPYLQRLLQNTSFIVYAALQGEETLGGLTAYVLPMYRVATSEIFLYDIAVKPEFQRKGIGRQLLDALLSYSQQNGFSSVFVPAHEEDTHALDFYRATGGEPEEVVYFTYSTNKKF